MLFVCWHNAARSQMAAALFHRASEHHVDSAGTHPARTIHPLVIEALREVGIDLREVQPQTLTRVLVECADVIVRCLAPDPDDYAWGDAKARFIDWVLPMPANESEPTLAEIRALRDAIAERVEALASELDR